MNENKTFTDVSGLSFKEQLELGISVAKAHYLKNKGEWPFFGKIVGYYFFYSFRENVRLNVDGNVGKRRTTPFEEPEGFHPYSNCEIDGQGGLQVSIYEKMNKKWLRPFFLKSSTYDRICQTPMLWV